MNTITLEPSKPTTSSHTFRGRLNALINKLSKDPKLTLAPDSLPDEELRSEFDEVFAEAGSIFSMLESRHAYLLGKPRSLVQEPGNQGSQTLTYSQMRDVLQGLLIRTKLEAIVFH